MVADLDNEMVYERVAKMEISWVAMMVGEKVVLKVASKDYMMAALRVFLLALWMVCGMEYE
jgi:hypothetical protein